ncbi:MAG: tyrosine-type recombinase/integrase [Desulfobacterales bacterium]
MRDSGARAGEIATLKLDYFDPSNHSLIILGKGNRFRQIQLEPKTSWAYQALYCQIPRQTQCFIISFVHQSTTRGNNPCTALTACVKISAKGLKSETSKIYQSGSQLSSQLRSRMLLSGKKSADIKNRLGHKNIQSTTVYTHMDLTRKQAVQEKIYQIHEIQYL